MDKIGLKMVNYSFIYIILWTKKYYSIDGHFYNLFQKMKYICKIKKIHQLKLHGIIEIIKYFFHDMGSENKYLCTFFPIQFESRNKTSNISD